MKISPLLAVLALLLPLQSSNAAIALVPLEDRVAKAETIVVGTVSLDKTEDGWHHGQITVTRSIKGSVKAGEKIPARWKVPPVPPKDPGVPRLPDYTYRPQLDKEAVIILNAKKEDEASHALGWGCMEPMESEEKVKALVSAGGDAPAPTKG